MLTLWDPLADFARFNRGFFPSVREDSKPEFRPSVDVYEDEKAIHVKAELAGVNAEDIKIELENNVLTLHGERKLDKRKDEGAYQRVERRYGEFCRSFALPDTVDAEGIDANYKDGILTVTLPKRPESQRREIKVTAN